MPAWFITRSGVIVPQQSTHVRPELSRALGPVTAGAILAGSVIGTGIFLVPATMAREAGSIGGVFAVWLFGALLTLCGAFTYAELGSSLPEAGGEYAFLRRAYGPVWGFLFGWQQIVIGKTGSIATIGIAASIFIGYFVAGLDTDIVHLGPLKVSGLQLLAIICIALLTGVNLLGVARGGAVQSVLTTLKIGAIIALVVVALTSGKGSWTHFTEAASSEPRTFSAILLGYTAALSAALWAYDGWNNLTMVSGEIRNPHRTIPQVLIMGILGVAAVYLLANLAYFYVLSFPEVQHSERVAQDVATTLLGSTGGQAITVAAAISTLGALNGAILSGARVFYAMARDGLFFKKVAAVHPIHHTPGPALILQGLLASGLILVLGHDKAAFERVLDYALLGLWGFYGLTSLSVIVLRYRHPDLPRPYLTLGYPWVPLIFSLVALLFCISIVWRRPMESLFGLVLLALGLPFYLYWQPTSKKTETRAG
jgi:amino acid transporter